MSHAAPVSSIQDGQSSALALTICSPLVSALFVQPDGCYAKLENVDLWPESRDARLYAGPLPVVAHPPCQLWVNLAALNFKRYGGEHNRPGSDGGCFAAALAAVRKWGGVLEHPAFSNAWKAYDIEAPRGCGWQRVAQREWVCEVWQSAYGHRARKRTWLFYSGDAAPFELRWTRVGGVTPMRLVRSDKADTFQAGRERHASRVPRYARAPRVFGEQVINGLLF